jgi:pyruvate/2-oxoglutarate dehydrogenase complex dihydrolipoamide dehydrogenase (E3) component
MPEESITYDLAVIGAGAAGLTASQTAAVLGWRVALIEGKHIGGDCTWVGCVPSKALLTVARRVYQARHSAHMGVYSDNVRVDFEGAMAFVKRTIAEIYAEETPEALRALGVDVYEAYASFQDAHTLSLSDGRTLRAKRFIIASGAKSIIPEGMSDAPYLTHETLFDLTTLPAHLLIVGGGAIGVEMAQAFTRLGSQVTLCTDQDRLLIAEDLEVSAFAQDMLTREGVRVHTNAKALRAGRQADGVRLETTNGTFDGSHMLIATGKAPDVRALHPERANIATTAQGALVLSPTLQTSQPHIYASGDVTGRPFYTHAAGSEASAAVLNLLLPFKSRKAEQAPRALFTSPEIAQVGQTEAEARAQHKRVFVTRLPFHRVDRAMTEAQPEGWLKLVHGQYGKLYGATIVGMNAADMANEWLAILNKGGRVSDMFFTAHIYPSFGSSNSILAAEFLRHMAHHTPLGRWIRRIVSKR